MATLSSGTDKPVRTIGRYELVAKVSAGSLGDLWMGRIASGAEEGRVVTIREIPRPFSLSDQGVSNLTAVGFSAMELRHPSVAAALDVIVSAKDIAIVSEHLEGTLLSDLLHAPAALRAKISPGVALRIALDLLTALEAVTPAWAEVAPSPPSNAPVGSKSGIHGGIVPDGVLVAVFGESMLLEVGFAAAAMSIPELAEKPDVIAYRAPEQIHGDRSADERSDVFTVGVLTWELLVGRPLFGGPASMPRPPSASAKADDSGRLAAVRKKVLEGPVQRVDALPHLAGKISKECADFVARCLERDRARRYQTLQEAKQALQRITGIAEHSEVAQMTKAARAQAGEPENSSNSAPATTPPDDRVTLPPETRPGAAAQPHVDGRQPVSTAPADKLSRIEVDTASIRSPGGRLFVESTEPISVEPVSSESKDLLGKSSKPAAVPPPAAFPSPKRADVSLPLPKGVGLPMPKPADVPRPPKGIGAQPAKPLDLPRPPAFLASPIDVPTPPASIAGGKAATSEQKVIAIDTASAAPVVRPLVSSLEAEGDAPSGRRSGGPKVFVLAIAIVSAILIVVLILRSRSSSSDESTRRATPQESRAGSQSSAAQATIPSVAAPAGELPTTTAESAKAQAQNPAEEAPTAAAEAAAQPATSPPAAPAPKPLPGRAQEPRRDGKKPYRPSGI